MAIAVVFVVASLASNHLLSGLNVQRTGGLNNFTPSRTMIALIRPVLMSFLNSDKVKRLIVDMLRKLAEQSDNTVDDAAVDFIERGLFGG